MTNVKKAITTKYYPPTATRSACIRATDNDGNTVRIGYEEMTSHEFGEQRHRAAAVALSVKMGWSTDNLVAGALGGTGNYVFVEAPRVEVTHGEERAGPRVCIELTAPHQYGVKVEQFANKRFRVTYGKQVEGKTAAAGLGYGHAAREFGECVFHALACADLLDNSSAL